MGFFRNPEIKAQLIFFLLLTIIISVAAWGFLGFTAFAAALCTSVIFFISAMAITYFRYKRIASLANEIDAILHGKEQINLSEYGEGELAVLKTEVEKLVIRLREKTDMLQKERVILSDSMADISHQIRTPLTSINLVVSMLSEPGMSGEDRMRLIKELNILLSRIDWLITALLKMSKLDADTVKFKNETIGLAELLQKASEPLLIPMELRMQKFTISVKPESAAFTGDISWMCEAIGNILKNCMEHTATEGEISVNASENAIYTEIVIADSGSGIASEDLPHLFERFYKGKDASEKSVGIGLALSRMIILKQNGTIKAENRRDGGARFTIKLYKSVV